LLCHVVYQKKEGKRMKVILILAAVLVALLLLGWFGLQVKPRPFPPHEARTPSLNTVPLPTDLPAPVERFYRAVYGEQVPVIETVVLTGRATIRPVMNIPLPARFIFVHNAGRDYRHYIEATWFGLAIMKVNEGYVDAASFFEAPMGTIHDDPAQNQAANLALWAEGAWFPAIMVTDPRVRWAPVDEETALLYVPFEEEEETFVVRFDPETGLMASLEAMRYRETGTAAKILWITRIEKGPNIPGTNIGAAGSAIWLDQGRPWAVFTVEDAVYNVDVGEYIRQRGPS
jgi:hypothetical protein